jgi:hypothetical protein
MTDLSPETVGKLVDHARRVVAKYHDVKPGKNPELDDLRAIVAELPEPVDQDLVEARKVCEEVIPSGSAFLEGEWDDGDIMVAALAAIKRGRALAGGNRS